ALFRDRLFTIGLRNFHVAPGLLDRFSRYLALLKSVDSSQVVLCPLPFRISGLGCLGGGFSFFVPVATQQPYPRLPSTFSMGRRHINFRADVVTIYQCQEGSLADLL